MQGDQRPSSQRSIELPILAAREQDSPAEDSPPAISPTANEPPSNAVRRARLSHRSRAGCWTCRGRKVKCDEQRPRCGQCLRLNRECDWEHRWSFNHATSTTQSRHSNVTTTGSTVWDPHARRSGRSSSRASSNDNLGAFATLTNDDDRQRKARSAAPGTYSVVVTPESFASLPEYASSGSNSPGSRQHGRLSSQSSSIIKRRTSSIDTNTVVLDQFEDTAAQAAAASRSFSSRSSSLPGGTSHPLPQMSALRSHLGSIPPLTTSFRDDDRLSACFNQYLVYRLMPWINDTNATNFPNLATNRDLIQQEAANFSPLRSAIDALSALHLYYSGQEQLSTAVSYYDQALSIQTPLDENDHLSDGIFLRHFLLYVYDIVMTPQDGPSSAEETSMSTTNLNTLHKLAVQRFEQNGEERLAWIVWLLGLLDLEACFMGSGDCHFFRQLLDDGVLPLLSRQTPVQQGQARAREAELLRRVLDFQQGLVVQLAKLGAVAHSMRRAVLSASNADLHELILQCQARVAREQAELKACWPRCYPEGLPSDPSQAARNLPPRIRALFEHAVSLYSAGVIYSHTSMYPRQRSYHSGDQRSIDSEIETCNESILEIATNILASQRFDQRWIVFPVFMAGIATKQSDAMVQALEIIRGLEGSGIGQNTKLVRQLLTAVNEEQTQRIVSGEPMEGVDWQAVAQEKGFRISNCGL